MTDHVIVNAVFTPADDSLNPILTPEVPLKYLNDRRLGLEWAKLLDTERGFYVRAGGRWCRLGDLGCGEGSVVSVIDTRALDGYGEVWRMEGNVWTRAPGTRLLLELSSLRQRGEHTDLSGLAEWLPRVRAVLAACSGLAHDMVADRLADGPGGNEVRQMLRKAESKLSEELERLT